MSMRVSMLALVCVSAACGSPGAQPSANGTDPVPPSAADASSPAIDPSHVEGCDAPLVAGADRRCTLVVGGKQREVLLYAPALYDPSRPSALVVDAHGSSETDEEQAGKVPFLDWPSGLGSGFRLVADREGFVVAQPQGIDNAWTESDVAFALAIPPWVAKHAAIDPARVYLSGISNGGALTYWTACADTGVFSAFAPVSGFGITTCAAARRAPLVHFHSPDDKIVSIADGKAAFDAWSKSHGCKHGPIATWTFGGPTTDPRPMCVQASASGSWSLATCDRAAPPTTCETWDQCDGGGDATFCTVPADHANHYDTTGGHVLYVNATGLSLAAVAWSIFERPR
jgi:poly(3-hydroxybutyrate) depolymerase